MFNFLHTFHPSPVLISLGPVTVYWYGFFIVLGILASLAVAVRLAKAYGLKADVMIDLAIWLVVGGLIGARLYDVGLEWGYYAANPLDVFKVWQGGLAIHGAIIGGLVALWLFARKNQAGFWLLVGLVATVLPLGQAIGRWGNYFNQELFGPPTNLPWGIPIDPLHRPWQFLNDNYFQPAFLYEFLGDLAIFALLMLFHYKKIAKGELRVVSYIMAYSALRFFTEFIRVDATPVFFGLRFPQLVSLLVIIFCLVFLAVKFGRKNRTKPALEK